MENYKFDNLNVKDMQLILLSLLLTKGKFENDLITVTGQSILISKQLEKRIKDIDILYTRLLEEYIHR